MMELQVIDKREVLGQEITTYGDLENPLFLAKDVANWIEHTNITHMINMVDADEKLTYTICNSGQNREMWFLTEDGLYEVLMQSRKPIAKQFKKKVKKLLKDLRLNNFNWNDPYKNLSSEMKAIIMHDKKIQKVEKIVEKVDQKFDDLPLFPSDSKVLKKLANQTVVPLLGGKKSNAYKKLSRKVFSDLYKQIHREFDVVGCEEIKRKDLEFAKGIIYNYKLPRALEEEIKLLNSQVAFA
ncbi:ORF6C domain-containing protein [Paraclostridium bifermentans]|uniref:ORF6C domain-containing protein n=1 Tax=Paraclostridium bifermentans TaxID=1490 RepID=UPI002432B855|nr:ORF6C domain-containing protein [Paraclostridium bifermentans]